MGFTAHCLRFDFHKLDPVNNLVFINQNSGKIKIKNIYILNKICKALTEKDMLVMQTH